MCIRDSSQAVQKTLVLQTGFQPGERVVTVLVFQTGLQAPCLLYTSDLPVRHGKRLGTALGFPTINQIYPDWMLLPRQGV